MHKNISNHILVCKQKINWRFSHSIKKFIKSSKHTSKMKPLNCARLRFACNHRTVKSKKKNELNEKISDKKRTQTRPANSRLHFVYSPNSPDGKCNTAARVDRQPYRRRAGCHNRRRCFRPYRKRALVHALFAFGLSTIVLLPSYRLKPLQAAYFRVSI